MITAFRYACLRKRCKMLHFLQTSVDREEKNEMSCTILLPVQASDRCQTSESSFRGFFPVREDDGNKEGQRTKKRGRDEQIDVSITNDFVLKMLQSKILQKLQIFAFVIVLQQTVFAFIF